MNNCNKETTALGVYESSLSTIAMIMAKTGEDAPKVVITAIEAAIADRESVNDDSQSDSGWIAFSQQFLNARAISLLSV